MTTGELAAGAVLKKDLDEIDAMQAKTATAGARVHLSLTTATSTLAGKEEIIAALGQAAYDTICATALGSINSQLGSIETTKLAELAAL